MHQFVLRYFSVFSIIHNIIIDDMLSLADVERFDFCQRSLDQSNAFNVITVFF